jgi:hypothetical protein
VSIPRRVSAARIVLLRSRAVIHHRRAGDAFVTRVINIGWIPIDPPGIVVDSVESYSDHV